MNLTNDFRIYHRYNPVFFAMMGAVTKIAIEINLLPVSFILNTFEQNWTKS